MKKKVNIERIALIIGTVLGVVAFFWQVYDSVDKQREKVQVQMTFSIPKEDLPIDVSIEVINYGQRPVYIKKVLLHEIISKSTFGNPQATADILVFLEDKTQTDPIAPGQSRIYTKQISYQELQDWQVSIPQIYLTVQSPTKTLFSKDTKDCVDGANYWAKFAKEDEKSGNPFGFGLFLGGLFTVQNNF